MCMVLQYLKELVGEYKQPILIDGELLTSSTSVIYCRKVRGVITFLTVNSKKEELYYDTDEVLEFMQQKINLSISKSPYPITGEELHSIVCCKLTNMIVIKTQYYALMSDSKGHEITNKTIAYKNALNQFYVDELINYYLLYTRILRPRVSRKANIIIKAHLVNNFFIPLRISSKYINCTFDYSESADYLQSLLRLEKVLTTSESNQSSLNLSVLAGCDFAEFCNITVRPLEPNYIMFGIIYKCLSKFGQDALARFLQTYPTVVSSLEIKEDEAVTETKIQRYESFNAIATVSLMSK